MKRDFLTVGDLSKEELEAVIKRAVRLKSGEDKNNSPLPLTGKSLGMLFERPSTRTRVSFETAIYQLGGQAICLTASELQLNRGETLADTAKTLSRYLHGMILRTSSHARLTEFAKSATIPVINALSEAQHPCQAVADLMTIYEKKGRLVDVRLAFIGDGNNVANSLIEAASVMGVRLVVACPEGHEPDQEVIERAKAVSGADIIILRDPKEAAGKADVIYTDVWVSMGQETEAEKRKARFRPYQINNALLACAEEDVMVMHCLPAYRGQEITDEVMDGPNSVVFDQAENRLHTQKALLEFLVR